MFPSLSGYKLRSFRSSSMNWGGGLFLNARMMGAIYVQAIVKNLNKNLMFYLLSTHKNFSNEEVYITMIGEIDHKIWIDNG